MSGVHSINNRRLSDIYPDSYQIAHTQTDIIMTFTLLHISLFYYAWWSVSELTAHNKMVFNKTRVVKGKHLSRAWKGAGEEKHRKGEYA